MDNDTKADNENNLDEVRNANYAKNMKIYGDAVRETSTAGTGDTSWQNNKSNFGGLYFPFMVRDGSLWDGLHLSIIHI